MPSIYFTYEGIIARKAPTRLCGSSPFQAGISVGTTVIGVDVRRLYTHGIGHVPAVVGVIE
jgi:hypothetical protein